MVGRGKNKQNGLKISDRTRKNGDHDPEKERIKENIENKLT